MKPLPMVPTPPSEAPAPANAGPWPVADAARTAELKPKIIDAISTVFDPEIPVNIYELGLIYDVIVDADGVAGVQMTLTAPGCPAAQELPVEVANKVKTVPGITDARVDIVWEPAWTKDRMSDAAKLQLGMW
jgi:FeS assembly SUF system protein